MTTFKYDAGRKYYDAKIFFELRLSLTLYKDFILTNMN